MLMKQFSNTPFVVAVKMWLLIAFIVIVVLYIILGFICGFDFGKCGNDKK